MLTLKNVSLGFLLYYPTLYLAFLFVFSVVLSEAFNVLGRFHPSCMGMTIDEAKMLEQFLCGECASEEDAKRSSNTFPVPEPSTEAKVEP